MCWRSGGRRARNCMRCIRERRRRSWTCASASTSGGLSLEEAAERPIRTALSGPAAGVVGALSVARIAGVRDLVTLDMGGTSTDVALVAGGECALTDEAEVAGVVVQLPMLAIHT